MRIRRWGQLLFIFLFVGSCMIMAHADELWGKRTVRIPTAGTTEYEYVPVKNGEPIPQALVTAQSLPNGTAFDTVTKRLIVTSSAKSGDTAQLSYTDSSGARQTVTVVLTDSMVQNGTFDDLPAMSGWNRSASSSLELLHEEDTSYIVMNADTFDEEENSFSCVLFSDFTVPMESGKLYVLRMDVRTSSEYEAATSNPRNFGVSEGDVMDIVIEEMDSSWESVYAVLHASVSGVYPLRITFLTPTERPVMVRNISLVEEARVPSQIKLSTAASFYVPAPDTVLTFPVVTEVLDQTGTPMPEESLTVTLMEEGPGMTYDPQSGLLTVTSAASVGTHTLMAVCDSRPELVQYFMFHTVISGVFNGSFELTPIGTGWSALEPAVLKVGKKLGNRIAPDGSLFASLTLNQDTAVLYNNSYVAFRAGQSYVFSLSGMKKYVDVDTVVAIFVEELNREEFDDSLIAAYFTLAPDWEDFTSVFTFDRDITGRLLIAVMTPQEHDQQIVFLDNLSVEYAQLRVRGAVLNGTPRVGETLSVSYEFVNNYGSEDASMIRWLVSSEPEGEYQYLALLGSSQIMLDESLEGKYLCAEIVPISVTAGVFGEPVRTKPLKIEEKKKTAHGGSVSSHSEPKDENPKEDNITLTPRTLPVYSQNRFEDMVGHWAILGVGRMADAGIVAGYEDGTFRPENHVTRAEFVALLLRTFDVPEAPYSAAFFDVAPNAWYTGVVEAAAAKNWIRGRQAQYFMPNEAITRGEIAQLIAYMLVDVQSPKIESYRTSQDAPIELTQAQCMTLLLQNGILYGYEDGTVRPERSTTRAEAISILERLIDAWQDLKGAVA